MFRPPPGQIAAWQSDRSRGEPAMIGALMEETAAQSCVRCGEPVTLGERAWFELESNALKLTSLREMFDDGTAFKRVWHVRCVDAPLRPRGH